VLVSRRVLPVEDTGTSEEGGTGADGDDILEARVDVLDVRNCIVQVRSTRAWSAGDDKNVQVLRWVLERMRREERLAEVRASLTVLSANACSRTKYPLTVFDIAVNGRVVMADLLEAMRAKLSGCDHEISFQNSSGAKISITDGFGYRMMP
jgi:hypothetical protein